jgi:hypothetical protein
MSQVAVSAANFDADNIEEFAVKHRISRAQVYKEIAAGRLEARKVGGRTIILREAAAAWRASLPTLVPTS